MKKTLFVLLALLLAAAVLVACGNTENSEKPSNGPTEDVSVYHAEGFEKSTLVNQISWEGINSIPIKTANMPIKEARQICVDFFRYAKTCTWIPSEDYGIWADATIHQGEEPKREMFGGQVYGGLPYISWATGSPYRLMDYLDPVTGVVDMSNAGDKPILFGNQCANGAYVGFARVINSAKYGVTAAMVQANGLLRLGDYTYPDSTERWTKSYGTPNVLKENSVDTIMESYALLQAGDAIVYWTTAGHIVMIATDAVVERTADGKINPLKSFVTIIDQSTQFVDYQHKDGDACKVAETVDAKWSFQKLYNENYLPMTFAEWTGADPIESSKTEIDYKDETISLNKIPNIKITSNYGITDAYVSIYNANGVEVYKIAVRSTTTSVKEVKLLTEGYNVDLWGNKDNLKPAEYEYTVKISAQLSTGERPVLWEGKLVE